MPRSRVALLLHPTRRVLLPLGLLVVVILAAGGGGLLLRRWLTPGPVMLPHPLRYQQTYLASCEVAATHIALAMSGITVSENQLLAELPVDTTKPQYGPGGLVTRWGNPYRTFVGSVVLGDEWPLKGYGVYATPILSLLERNQMSGSYGGAGLTAAQVRSAVNAGHPVIVWAPKLSLYKYPEAFIQRTWRAWDGTVVLWNEWEHAQVVVGYNADGPYLDNPDYSHYSGGRWLWHYTWAQFQRGWNVLGDQGVVVVPSPLPSTPGPTPLPPLPSAVTPVVPVTPVPPLPPPTVPGAPVLPAAKTRPRPTPLPTRAYQEVLTQAEWASLSVLSSP